MVEEYYTMILLPGKPVAHNYGGLLSVNNGLLWGIVAYYFGPLGVPGRALMKIGTIVPLEVGLWLFLGRSRVGMKHKFNGAYPGLYHWGCCPGFGGPFKRAL